MRMPGCIGHDRGMEQILSSFSANLADLVERTGQSAVGIEARHRIGSSGFLWKPGVIVTTDHSLHRDEDIPVVLPGGHRASAELAGRDPDTDIAVLRVAGIDAPPLEQAPASRAGELVLAVGRHAPGILATLGIVGSAGAQWKTWRGGQLDSLLRLDMGAYPRSSGSMVTDTEGRLVGMLTTGLTRTAPVAIPASTMERVASELLSHGRIARGYLGVGLQPVALPPALSALLHRDQRSAAIVLSVEPGGPADSAGIRLGDVIAEIHGRPIADIDDIRAALHGLIGAEVAVTVLRGGERAEVRATVGGKRD
jgi:S1-C subfamily serine protease